MKTDNCIFAYLVLLPCLLLIIRCTISGETQKPLTEVSLNSPTTPTSCLTLVLMLQVTKSVQFLSANPTDRDQICGQRGALAAPPPPTSVVFWGLNSTSGHCYRLRSQRRCYLPHLLQLPLFVLVGRLQLLHPVLQVLHLHLLPLPQLPAPEPGFAVRGRQPQAQLLDAGLNG